MAELIGSSAQSAVDSLLGRLTRILEDEAKLLSGVHGDVQFIRDEMESMNGFLLHLVDVNRPGHQVQAWMWQVKSLARDSENCVDRYMKFVGGTSARCRGRLLGPLWRVLRFLWTLRARHQVATQIQELRCRAQDVGERRLRYGVVIPVPLDDKSNNQGRGAMEKQVPIPGDEIESQDSRSALLDVKLPDPATDGDNLEMLLDWLIDVPVEEGRTPHTTYPRVFTVLWPDDDDKLLPLQQFLFQNKSQRIMYFDTKVLVYMGETHLSWAMEDILNEIVCVLRVLDDEDARSQSKPLEQKVNDLLSGKRYLLVLSDVRDASLWPRMKSAFRGHDPSSAIVLSTQSHAVARSSSPFKVFSPVNPLVRLFSEKAYQLVENNPSKEQLKPLLEAIVSECAPNVFCLKAFLHALYADPERNTEELSSLRNTLSDNSSLSNPDANTQKILLFWYDVLPIHYKRCLMYLSIYPKDGGNIRRTSMVRRWVAENLITGRDGFNAEDQAERCFRMLLDKRFVLEEDISSTTGKFKTLKVNSLISEFVKKAAREEHFVDADLHPDFSHRVSLHSRSQIQQALVSLHESRPNSCWNWNISCKPKEEKEHVDELTMLLQSTAFARMGLLKVLDLEGYDSLSEHHLVNICKIFQLKYLNLRRTQIAKLPKEIDNLQQLETLDIRETNISSFATKSLALPMLKHILAGPHAKHPSVNTKPFSTVRLPRGVGSMTKLQILCHVDVSHHEDRMMNEIGKLLQLRKLGVVFRGKEEYVKQFLWVIDRLNQSLLSLSIHVKAVPEDDDEIVDIHRAKYNGFSPPKFLQCLSIHGTTLPDWIKDLNRLAKLTLCRTRLDEDHMKILAELKGLRCLRLHQQSYVRTKLTLGGKDFPNLTFLLIQGSDITDISFNKIPKLEKIVWCFNVMKSISGVGRLPSLKMIQLIGNCNPEDLIDQLSQHPNQPVVSILDRDSVQASSD